jgi:hypothetical protein
MVLLSMQLLSVMAFAYTVATPLVLLSIRLLSMMAFAYTVATRDGFYLANRILFTRDGSAYTVSIPNGFAQRLLSAVALRPICGCYPHWLCSLVVICDSLLLPIRILWVSL